MDREASVLAFRDSYCFVILAIGALLPFVWLFRGRVFDMKNLGGGIEARGASGTEAQSAAAAH
ncbi:MAG TPA: hypothetical protein VFT98_19895 [Myxococcota bacterium]|nr:hypothetical protein [Myxococcota bacterium]